jgi:hypothetical protein
VGASLFLAYLGTVAVLGLGMLIDESRGSRWRDGLAECAVFAIVLAGVFLLSRVRPRPAG